MKYHCFFLLLPKKDIQTELIMRKIFYGIIAAFSFGAAILSAKDNVPVKVDKRGRMISTATGKEVRYYGTNYTLPFAHAYRAMDYKGVDHKAAIDRDVYHISRLGLNAFRVHIWDVEISDSIGNVVDNDHLNLLDYLISKMEERGIDVILTAQTNFGNGYPEKNKDTGAYSYDYEKCDIHENPHAIAAQRRYIEQLVGHVNPYTGLSYASDPHIIAMEINNEPCHDTSEKQITAYINSMVKAMKRGGWKKLILYNVSHNTPLVQGYYDADIDGTTYQWYPIGLVAGQERKGNFLPYLDNYSIPFSDARNFGNKAKVVYEYDPADVLASYLYPAAARTFAREGFQWVTQFSYDPIDIAAFNTEYQTHYLNLAYTPQKALGMRIAAHAMAETPTYGKLPKYPNDTIFGDITVSYHRNLALLNSPREYVYTNSHDVKPVAFDSLLSVAGFGSSPLIEYDGRGAYMLDLIQPGVWRLELMPDVLYAEDPFTKPSLKTPKAYILNNVHPMTIKLPGLGRDFSYMGINNGNTSSGKASGDTITLKTGTYLLSSDAQALSRIDPEMRNGFLTLNEYVALPMGEVPMTLVHHPRKEALKSESLVIRAEVFGTEMPDSVLIYPTTASFWVDHNKLYKMVKKGAYEYDVEIPAEDLRYQDNFGYRIVCFVNGEKKTYPSAIEGAPLDWDAPESSAYTTALVERDAPLVVLYPSNHNPEISTIPDSWNRVRVSVNRNAPVDDDYYNVKILPGSYSDTLTLVVGEYVKELIQNRGSSYRPGKLVVKTKETGGMPIEARMVNSDGITYGAPLKEVAEGILEAELKDFCLTSTLLCPAPFPTFLEREFTPDAYSKPFDIRDAERLQLVISPNDSSSGNIKIVGAWLK